jgi:hypothetical protein
MYFNIIFVLKIWNKTASQTFKNQMFSTFMTDITFYNIYQFNLFNLGL